MTKLIHEKIDYFYTPGEILLVVMFFCGSSLEVLTRLPLIQKQHVIYLYYFL